MPASPGRRRIVAMSESNVVTVRGLRKRYGDRTVVDGFDLDVAAGEIVGLIGANGAGKTTTVECIQGLRRPDAGSLRVLGLDPVTEPDRLRTMIGSQLQSSALPDRLRVGEAVRLFSGRNGRELLRRSEEHTSELQSPDHLVCRLLLEKKKNSQPIPQITQTAHTQHTQNQRILHD